MVHHIFQVFEQEPLQNNKGKGESTQSYSPCHYKKKANLNQCWQNLQALTMWQHSRVDPSGWGVKFFFKLPNLWTLRLSSSCIWPKSAIRKMLILLTYLNCMASITSPMAGIHSLGCTLESLGEFLRILSPLAMPHTKHLRISGSGIRHECFWNSPGEARGSQDQEIPLGRVNSWWIPTAFLQFYTFCTYRHGPFPKRGASLHHHGEYMHKLCLSAFPCIACSLQSPSRFDSCGTMLW